MLLVPSMCSMSLQHTLETALLSASQEIEMGSDNPAAMQSVIQQRDLLQSGLLSTCRELSRVTAVSHIIHSLPQALYFLRDCCYEGFLSPTKYISLKPGV